MTNANLELTVLRLHRDLNLLDSLYKTTVWPFLRHVVCFSTPLTNDRHQGGFRQLSRVYKKTKKI